LQVAPFMAFEGHDEPESRRARNARWRREAARWRSSKPSVWTPTELIWLKRLETLLEESRTR